MDIRSALLMQARFFFEPRQLSTQSSDLGIQVVQLLVMLRFPGFFALTFVLEQLAEVFQCLFLPLVDLVRMDTVLRSDLGNAFLFLQRFQHDCCFLAGTEPSSFVGHRFFSKNCTLIMPVFLSKFPYPLNYMATLVATRRNPVIRTQYQHLLKRGKEKKVALTACMRKFLTILNAMQRDQQPFRM